MKNLLLNLPNLRQDKAALAPLKLLGQMAGWFFRAPESLSYGKISAYLSCPLKYKFQYQDHVPVKSSANLSFGSSLHKTLEEFHAKHDVKTASPETILAILDSHWISDGYESPADEETAMEKARAILKKYLDENRDLPAQPRHVNKPAECQIGEFPVKGRFDRVDQMPDGKLMAVDYRTGKELDEKQLKRELQPKLYTILGKKIWGDKFGGVAYHYLETGRKVTPQFTREEIRQTLQTVKDVGSSIYKGKFDPHPSALCSWCNYQTICPEWKGRSSSKGLFRLSYSKMMSYKLCPRSYKFLYVDRVPPQPRSFFSIGIAVHGALEEFCQYDGYLKEPGLDYLMELLKKNWVTAGFTSAEEEQKYYSEAEAMLKVYYRDWIKGKYKKAFVCEPYFELPIGDFVMIGYIDRVDELPDGTLEVIDYKTEPKIRTQQEVDDDLQLTVYYWACIQNYGRAPSKVSLQFMRHNQKISTTRSQKDIDKLVEVVNDIGGHMRDEKAYEPKLNKYCSTCDHLAGCPLETEARAKAKEEAEMYQKIVETVKENLALNAATAGDGD